MRTGLPKSTVHRTAQQMIKLGWLNYREGQYSLGTRMFEFAGLSPVRTELRESALPFLEDLYEATHATVHLGVMDGLEILYIDKISGHDRVTDLSRVGGRMPLHCTSLGKSILAFSPQEVRSEVIRHGLPQYTGPTITSAVMLERELTAVAARQVAFDRQESSMDIICAGARCSGPVSRLSPPCRSPAQSGGRDWTTSRRRRRCGPGRDEGPGRQRGRRATRLTRRSPAGSSTK